MSQPSESDIEASVGKYAKRHGVLPHKFTSPQRRSVPDRVYIFPNGLVVFIEFKRYKKKPTDGQKREINRLIERRQWVYVIDGKETGRLLVDAIRKLPPGTIAPEFPPIPT